MSKISLLHSKDAPCLWRGGSNGAIRIGENIRCGAKRKLTQTVSRMSDRLPTGLDMIKKVPQFRHFCGIGWCDIHPELMIKGFQEGNRIH